MDEGDPEKIRLDSDTKHKKIETLTADIDKYEPVEWKNITHVQTKHFRGERDKLMKEQKAVDEKMGDNTSVVKSLIGDKSRLNNNHLQRMRKLKEEEESLKERQTAAVKKEEEQKQEQEENT